MAVPGEGIRLRLGLVEIPAVVSSARSILKTMAALPTAFCLIWSKASVVFIFGCSPLLLSFSRRGRKRVQNFFCFFVIIQIA